MIKNKGNGFIQKLRDLTSSPIENDEAVNRFPSTKGGKIISLKEFIKLEPEDIDIYVVRPIQKILSHTVKLLVYIYHKCRSI